MEITDGAAWLIGTMASAGAAAGLWLYARISGVHGRIDKVANHMTAEDNKLHARIDDVREKYVRREDLDQQLRRLEVGQEKLVVTLEGFITASRHKMNNIEQVMVRVDERLKHVEGGK